MSRALSARMSASSVVAHALWREPQGMQDVLIMLALVLALIALGIAAHEFGADTRQGPDTWW